MSTQTCDNKRGCHDPQVIFDDNSAMVAVCKICWEQRVFRKDPEGRMNNLAYLSFFKRDHLQPWDNLYYKYQGRDKMSVV